MKEKLIVGAAIGDCVHVAGVVNFLDLAEQLGYETVCLGPAVSLEALLDRVAALDPALVAVGYRLTPENCRSLLGELAAQADVRGQSHRTWLFGGTEPCVAAARAVGLFERTFASGTSKQAVVAYLRGEQTDATPGAPPPQTLMERIRWKAPYPLLRHHFGRPTVEEPTWPPSTLTPGSGTIRWCAVTAARAIPRRGRTCWREPSTTPGAPSRCSGTPSSTAVASARCGRRFPKRKP